MAAPLLILKDIHLTFGGHPLLDGAELAVHEGDRLCVVGRNGSGKSTLLKIAAGLVEADRGERTVRAGTSISYLAQEPDLSGFATTLDYVLDGLVHGDDPSRAYYLLAHLGLSGEEDPARLSGGEARRAALARALAPEPDILMLDEPTNHLDLPAIEWLEAELKSMRCALVLISHDRAFLSALSEATLWVYQGHVRRMDKGFSAFEDWRDQTLEQLELDAHKMDRKIVREMSWLSKGVTGRRKRNVRRLKELQDLRQSRRERRGPTGTVTLAASEAQASGKVVMAAEGLTKAFGERGIVKDLDIKVMRGDRLGLIGPNGAGKTTLIKLLTGEIAPDAGTLKLGTKLEMVSLDQKRESLNPDWSLAEALTQGSGDQVTVQGQPRHVVGYMKDFLFDPAQKNTPISALSGGERGRLMLARALARESNLLVLDEPTNDLDLETLDLLQDMLGDYAGTVILVSHDRDFLDRVATSVLAFEGDGVWAEYPGGYADMVDQRGQGVVARTGPVEKSKSVEKPKAKPKPKASGKLSYKDKYALETLPGEIAQLEEAIAKLEQTLADPDLFARDPQAFNAAAGDLDAKQTALADKEERWLELEMLREELEG